MSFAFTLAVILAFVGGVFFLLVGDTYVAVIFGIGASVSLLLGILDEIGMFD